MDETSPPEYPIKHLNQPRPDKSPWHYLGLDLTGVNPIGSMIIPDESVYLHWLAGDYYEGKGEILDAGPLLGGSTFALASGLERNSRVLDKNKRIHSYDLFKYFPDFEKRVLPDKRLNEGDSLLPIFLENTKTYRDYIEVTPGDILQHKWTGDPIEILFIDLAKSQEINEHLVKEFFGCLIPQHSIVVQQDYFHYQCYWIHLTMQHLGEYFEVTDTPNGATLSFLCTKAIPREVLTGMRWTNEESVRLMDEAIKPLRGFWRLLVKTAKIHLLADLGEYEAGAALCREVRESPDWCELLEFDLERATAYIPIFYRSSGLGFREKVLSYYAHGGAIGVAQAGLHSIWRRLR
jgi:hypothetical protein